MGDKEWFSSHGQSMSMLDFIALEVNGRGNYTDDEVDPWFEKYDLSLGARVIWVTGLENCAAIYCDLADPIKMDVMDIILESDDGDEGYLGVL